MLSIELKLYPPFSDVVGGRKLQLKFDCEFVTLETVFKALLENHPDIEKIYPSRITNENIYGFCYPVRQGELLKLNENLRSGDIIEIYGSLQGG